LYEHERRQFEQAFLPHMTAAYNLGRWLMGDEHEAEDMVQEAYLRAMRSFASFHGTDGRAWLLTIVRNSCYDRLRHLGRHGAAMSFDEELHGTANESGTPETLVVAKEERQSVQQAVEALPPQFKEVIVLREIEGLSYKEIAAAADISIGTVMSRLARARALLQRLIEKPMPKDV
jgi:RNA polymerase sigma-70 factor (ECF subfamily)